MNTSQSFLLGTIAGAGLMYLLDPDRGTRRRALVRDQIVHGAHELGDRGEAVGSRARDLRNRAYGAAAEARARLRREPVDDVVLHARVRAGMGRVASNPGAIEVTAEGGRVTLAGPVLEEEANDLLECVEGVPGVREVVNRLEARSAPDEAPALQGVSTSQPD